MSEFDVYVFTSLIPVPAPPAENVLGCRERSEGSFQDRSIGEGVSGGEGAGSGVDAPLHGWKGNISFEKTLPAGAVSARFQLTFPATFVYQHGDKFRERVVLQSVEDRRTWTVNVKVHFPRQQLQVTICGGAWKPFAVSHGLVEGDRLWFTLVAMSKFEVLVIRSSGIPKDVRLCVQRPVKRFKREGPEFSQTDWHPPTLLESQHRNLACESNVKLERESSSELFAQEGAAEDCVGTYSTFGSLPSSSDTDSDNSERCGNSVDERSKGMLIAEFIMRRSGGSRVNDTLRDWKGKISFKKILTTGAVSRRFQLPIPKAFVRQHGDKIRKHAVLQSVEDRKMWTVKVMARVPCKYLQVKIWGGNWKAFVVYNGLVEGDRLTFTLMAISMFEVLIHRSGGSVKTIQKSKYESAFSQTRNSNVKLEREWSSELFAEKGAAEDTVGTYSGSASSKSPSNMDSHNFE